MHFILADTGSVTLNVGLITAIVGILTITGAVFAFVKYVVKNESATLKSKITELESDQDKTDKSRTEQHAEVMGAINNIGEIVNTLKNDYTGLSGKLETLKTELNSSLANSKTEALRESDSKIHDLETKLRKEFGDSIEKVKDQLNDLKNSCNNN